MAHHAGHRQGTRPRRGLRRVLGREQQAAVPLAEHLSALPLSLAHCWSCVSGLREGPRQARQHGACANRLSWRACCAPLHGNGACQELPSLLEPSVRPASATQAGKDIVPDKVLKQVAHDLLHRACDHSASHPPMLPSCHATRVHIPAVRLRSMVLPRANDLCTKRAAASDTSCSRHFLPFRCGGYASTVSRLPPTSHLATSRRYRPRCHTTRGGLQDSARRH